ncbi:hypothetical protein F4553_007945 [Allocatelliglobosispora scoriae]|uniref:Uncharacterized protein n=1 Tax=Allocatelliglobosispora scoriae TaxID=643052 RepID=A0A841C6V2_9ACTN|nr:hypothetical protein [Allocatelliglobosispora scoriae]MBB5874511.1 hypothetical protein [Allocatelliglobosispora scoriae]
MSNVNFLINGRRAAVGALVVAVTAALGLVATPGIAAAASFSSFSAGVFAPGQVKHVWWNNANSDAYAPGLQAVGVDDPDVFCNVEVLRTWYQRTSAGEREFHLEIEGDQAERCQVTVWLARLTKFRESATGDLAPGASKASVWNNAHSDQNIYAVGVLAAQPASGSCAIEVTTQYRTQPNGENEFVYRATNVGTVTCSAQLRHVVLPVYNSLDMIPVNPGIGISIWPELFPVGRKVVVPGAAPAAVSAGPCQFSVGTTSYVGADSSFTRYKNTGAVACGVKAVFAAL